MSKELTPEEKIAAAEKETAAAKQLLAEEKEKYEKLQKKHDALKVEYKDFKAESLELIKEAQKNSIKIISDKVVEVDGKKYQFTIAEFGVIGVKGKVKAEDLIKDPESEENAAILTKLIKMGSGILKEIVAPVSKEDSK